MLAYICLSAIHMILGCIYVWKVLAPHLLRQVGNPLGCRRTGAAVGFVCGARNSLEPFRHLPIRRGAHINSLPSLANPGIDVSSITRLYMYLGLTSPRWREVSKTISQRWRRRSAWIRSTWPSLSTGSLWRPTLDRKRPKRDLFDSLPITSQGVWWWRRQSVFLYQRRRTKNHRFLIGGDLLFVRLIRMELVLRCLFTVTSPRSSTSNWSIFPSIKFFSFGQRTDIAHSFCLICRYTNVSTDGTALVGGIKILRFYSWCEKG